MKKSLLLIFPAMLFAWVACSGLKQTAAVEPEGFVAVETLEYTASGDQKIRIGAFEILDHPVTNSEYRRFVDATGYPAPQYWKNGRIPAGREEYPVIYVNRDDAAAYTGWLTRTTGRVYRLPTSLEFEIAARGGQYNRDRYYWGDDRSKLDTALINFNADGKRRFDRWETYLKPARWGMRNSIGLWQMTGNVWQLVEQNGDPVAATYKFRIEEPYDTERRTMGGSWMSTKEFLNCGGGVGQSPGLRYPDIGLRVVRSPEGADWHVDNRNVAAIQYGAEQVTVSWALLPTDTKSTRFNIYRLRGNNRIHAVRLSSR